MIRFGSLDYSQEDREAVTRLVSQDDPMLSIGKNVALFEEQFARWLGVKYAVMVNSGTSALETALSAAKLCDLFYDKWAVTEEVVTTALTYPAVWNAVLNSGLKLKPVDVGDDFVVHGKQTLAVHLLGKTSQDFGIVEDASEALGSVYQQRKLGSFALLGSFSFYVCHQLTTVEGGAVGIRDSEYAEALVSTCRSIRDNGRACTCPICTLKLKGKCSKRLSSSNDRRWETVCTGHNFKPMEIQAVLGLSKLKRLDQSIRRRHEIFQIYQQHFGTFNIEEGEWVVPLAYPVKVKNVGVALARLEKLGIEARGMFPAYSSGYPNAYRASQSFVLLPSHQTLSDTDLDFIVETVRKCPIGKVQ